MNGFDASAAGAVGGKRAGCHTGRTIVVSHRLRREKSLCDRNDLAKFGASRTVLTDSSRASEPILVICVQPIRVLHMIPRSPLIASPVPRTNFIGTTPKRRVSQRGRKAGSTTRS
jgi:hypothetical protein